MSETISSSSSGIGFFGLLGVVFITLKVVGVEPVVSWSWWWVTLPLWGGFALMFVIAFVVLALFRPR